VSFSVASSFGSTDGIEGGLTSERGRGHAFGEADVEAASIVGPASSSGVGAGAVMKG
jgi:hypothetical protein